jgi:hypothetical protein
MRFRNPQKPKICTTLVQIDANHTKWSGMLICSTSPCGDWHWLGQNAAGAKNKRAFSAIRLNNEPLETPFEIPGIQNPKCRAFAQGRRTHGPA